MMKRKMNQLFLTGLLLLGTAVQAQEFKTDTRLLKTIDADYQTGNAQYQVMMASLKDKEGQFPKTFDPKKGGLETSGSGWWCSGFYPGTLLELYAKTKNPALLTEANRMMGMLAKEQYNKGTHDLGFMMYCSFGTALKIDPKPEYKQILINSAKSLSSRFDPKVGCIKSWDSKKNEYLVIIDNMMNLELLFWATRETGDSSFYKIAVTHANTTMKNHFRPDYSSYHVIDYNPQTGAVQKKRTAQGYADESAWARGQAWGLYGYTVMYRETQDKKYLDQANHIASFILNNPNMPKDKIPYWDFNAPNIPNALRDASAGAVMASALLELCRYNEVPKERSTYFKTAEKMLQSLSAAPYLAAPGTQGGFILQHSVGHFPQQTEIDVPLTYADYYFVEAMKRYATMNSFHPGQIWPDNKGVHINAHGGGILYDKGKYYWFGEHKVAGNAGNRAQVGVHVYSSTDLTGWKDEGIALKVSSDATSDIAKGCILERPKVVYNAATKKYVMWFHLELAGKGYSAARAGVATADQVTGPYTFVKSYRPNAGKLPFYPAGTAMNEQLNPAKPAPTDSLFMRDLPGGQMARDMTVFVDDDGKAYHVFSSEENMTLQLAELTPDYTGHTGKFVRIYVGHQTEAPALFKRNGTYYMIGSGCTGWAPNAARWFTATSLWGPWTFHGNPCSGEGAALTFGGQSTHVLPLAGKKDAFIFIADRWTPKNAIDGRYLWLPVTFKGDEINIAWRSDWDLTVFDGLKK